MFYEKQENLAKLWDVLAVYAWHDKDVGYGQGRYLKVLEVGRWLGQVAGQAG